MLFFLFTLCYNAVVFKKNETIDGSIQNCKDRTNHRMEQYPKNGRKVHQNILYEDDDDT